MNKVSQQKGEPLPTLLLACTQDTFVFLRSAKGIPQFWYLVPIVAQSKLKIILSYSSLCPPALKPPVECIDENCSCLVCVCEFDFDPQNQWLRVHKSTSLYIILNRGFVLSKLLSLHAGKQSVFLRIPYHFRGRDRGVY